MDFITLRRELIHSMHDIASQMSKVILVDYYDKLEKEDRYILAMFEDAYRSVIMFCLSIQNVAISQAGVLLRQLLEQTAICYILVTRPELKNDYVDHYKTRLELADLNKAKQIKKLATKYNIPNNLNALTFMDYGWIKFNDPRDCNEEGMLKYAGFEDIVSWKKQYLDKLAHSSFVSIGFVTEDNSFPIVNNFIEIACKLFDHLCVAFHNLTKFDFKFNDVDLFNSQFRELYVNYYIEN